MNPEPSTTPPAMPGSPLITNEITRVNLFIAIQVFFLIVSTFTGGFNYKLWSMLDTAILILAIGVTGLVLVLEEAKLRRLAFRAAIVIYLCGVLDMSINVLVSGVVGVRSAGALPPM